MVDPPANTACEMVEINLSSIGKLPYQWVGGLYSCEFTTCLATMNNLGNAEFVKQCRPFPGLNSIPSLVNNGCEHRR